MHLFFQDYERFTPHRFSFIPFVVRYFRNHELRYVFWGRIKARTHSLFLNWVASIILHRYRKLYGLELNFKKIGGGFVLFIHGI